MQIERFSGGAIIAHLKPSDAMALKIPLLEDSVQKIIAQRIQDSHAARQRSKQLLDAAKEAVEIFVEQDEDVAEDYISSFFGEAH